MLSWPLSLLLERMERRSRNEYSFKLPLMLIAALYGGIEVRHSNPDTNNEMARATLNNLESLSIDSTTMTG
jgi:hypothetical protein